MKLDKETQGDSEQEETNTLLSESEASDEGISQSPQATLESERSSEEGQNSEPAAPNAPGSSPSEAVPTYPALAGNGNQLPVQFNEPDASLLVRQLIATLPVPAPGTDYDQVVKDQIATLALYAELAPKDATESMLARMAVATCNAGMESAARAAKSGDVLPIREANLRLAILANLTSAKLLEMLHRHRRLQQPRKTIHRFSIKQ